MAVKDRWKTMFALQQTAAPKPQTGAEIGFTGTRIFAGLPMEEYNPELSFPRSVKVFDEMRRSDGQITAILKAVTLPIISTKWYVKPQDNADNADQAQDIADFVEDMLFNGLKYPWSDHLREALLMCVFGFSIFEKVFRSDTWNGRPVIVIDKFAPRVASSIWRFPQDENYDVAAVEQINYMTGQIKSIPIDRCLIYTHEREGSNIVGISMLRPAYKAWYIKDALYKIVATGIEKTIIGTPYAKLPQGYSEDQRSKVLAVISAIRAAEEAGFTLPADVTIDSLDSSGSAGVQNLATAFIEHMDTQIARSVLAQFINLGTMASASGGSYALGNTMVDLFVLGLEHLAKQIQGEVQKVIDQVVGWNFGPDAPVPKLEHERISSLFQDSAQIAQAIYWLGAGHALTPDDELENKVREMLGIPPLSKTAIDEKLMLPADKYNPDILNSKGPLTQQELQYIAQRVKELSSGSSNSDGSSDGGSSSAAANSATAAAMTEKNNSMKFDDPLSISTNGETPAAPGKWRRDLTRYEQSVKFDELDQKWNTLEDKFVKQLQNVLSSASDQYIRQVESILSGSGTNSAGKLAAVIALPFPMMSEVTRTIQSEMMSAYETGKQSVQQELQADGQDVQTPQTVEAALAAKAETTANGQISRLLSWLQSTAISSIERGLDPKSTISNMRTGANAFVMGANKDGNPQLRSAVMVTVAESINIGRSSAAKQIGIQGAQWSAVLDSKTCPLCSELDGQVIHVDDPDFDLFRPPAHNGCRCVWVYILDEEENVEFDWKTPHEADVKKYGHIIVWNAGLNNPHVH